MMKGTCKVLGGIMLVLGIIGTLVLAIAGGRTASIDYSLYRGADIEYQRNWLLTIGYLFGGGVSTAFVSTMFFALAEILDDLGSIKYLQNEMIHNLHEIQTNVSLCNTSESVGASNLHSNASGSVNTVYGFAGSGGWTCPECNRKNRSFEDTCVCGYHKE